MQKYIFDQKLQRNKLEEWTFGTPCKLQYVKFHVVANTL